MSRYYGGWAPYVSVEERRRKAERAMAKLRKTGHLVAPVTIDGRIIATTFWGRAWCDNLESYGDYESRLPRGRSYVRNGSVVDLQIAAGRVTAMVSGSELYNVTVTIKETAKTQWRAICRDCAGGIDSLVELLQGRFSKGVMERLCRQEGGLFPRPSEIRFSCSCPDHASLCKHAAAALYGIGARLDQQPELLFRLRAVDESELVAGIDTALPLSKTGPAAGRVLDTDDISALFGLDMASAEAPAASSPLDQSNRRGARQAESVVASALNTVAPATAAAKPAPTKPAVAKVKQKVVVKKRTIKPMVPQQELPSKATPTQQRDRKQAMTAKGPLRLDRPSQGVVIVETGGSRRTPIQRRADADPLGPVKAASATTPRASEAPARDRRRRPNVKDVAMPGREPKPKPVKWW
jgi:uncharacterized Zn finger protein